MFGIYLIRADMSQGVFRDVLRFLYSLLVEEWLKNDDFVAGFNESHECTQTAFVRPSGDGDFGIRVDILAKERRVGGCYCLF